MDFNKEKFKEVLHYIIHKCDMKETIFINNLLYFSDFNFFELYEKSLTNESYRKLPRGPAPIHFDVAVKELIDEGKINVTTKNISLGRVIYNYSSLKQPSINFSEDELFVINEVIDELSYMNANQISEYSHGDMLESN